MSKTKSTTSKPGVRFRGYASPNYTMVPDELFDEQLPDLSGGELKALLYIMRRTFGFKKPSDDISLIQICDGITTRDGRTLDRGGANDRTRGFRRRWSLATDASRRHRLWLPVRPCPRPAHAGAACPRSVARAPPSARRG